MRSKITKIALVLILLICFCGVPAFADSHVDVDVSGGNIHLGPSVPNSVHPFAAMFSNYKVIGNAILAVCTITAILFFLISVVRLGTVGAENERERTRIIREIFFAGAALVLLGGVVIVAEVSWNLFG